MLNLILTIAVQSMQPTYCIAITPTETKRVECSCGFTANSLKKEVCTSKAEPEAVLRKVTK